MRGWGISTLVRLAFLFSRPNEPPVWDIIEDTGVLGRGEGRGRGKRPAPVSGAGGELGWGAGGFGALEAP